MSEAAIAERTVFLTDNAARRIEKLRNAEQNPGLMLRLAVNGGGCSGFSYEFSLDDRQAADDRIFTHNGAALVIDRYSLDLVVGAEVDFVEDLVGSAFQINNPNATSTCGCGSSFSL